MHATSSEVAEDVIDWKYYGLIKAIKPVVASMSMSILCRTRFACPVCLHKVSHYFVEMPWLRDVVCPVSIALVREEMLWCRFS
jgi:hypothetical protein